MPAFLIPAEEGRSPQPLKICAIARTELDRFDHYSQMGGSYPKDRVSSIPIFMVTGSARRTDRDCEPPNGRVCKGQFFQLGGGPRGTSCSGPAVAHFYRMTWNNGRASLMSVRLMATKRFQDERGWFAETWSQRQFCSGSTPDSFRTITAVRSTPGRSAAFIFNLLPSPRQSWFIA